MNYEVMSKEFTGILITIHHVGRPIEERESYTLKNFITYHLKQHYQAILSILLKTIIISLLTMIFSYYYQIMIDSFSNYPYLKILLISGGFCLLYVFKLLLDYYRQHHILELSRTLNDEYVSKTMQNMIYQDFQYFQQLEKGALLSRAQNLFELSQYFIEFYHIVFIDCVMLLFICGVLLFINVFLFVVIFIMMGIILLLLFL